MPSRAKGRLLPSGLSRSRQYAALSIHGKVLYPLLEANADDQGRLSADPERVKWTVCPNVNEIPAERIPELLAEMQRAGLAIIYDDADEPVIQLTQWWADQSSMEWAYPSEFAPPKGWQDRLRIRGRRRVLTINWPGSTDSDPATLAEELPRQLRQANSLATAIGGGPSTPATPIGHPSDTRLSHRQHEHEHEVQQEEYPPYPPLPQTPPAQRPHAGQGNIAKKKEGHHGRRQGRRAETAAGNPRLPWKEVT